MTRVLVKGGTFGPRDECTQRGDDGTRLSTANHRSWRRREGPPPPTAGSPQGEHSPTLSPTSAGQCVCCQPPRFWLWQPQETQQESSTAPPKHQAVSGGFPHRDTHLCKDTQMTGVRHLPVAADSGRDLQVAREVDRDSRTLCGNPAASA